MTLEIGNLTDAITVQADNPLVQRSSSDLSVTLVEAQIQGLPLNGRNFVQLTRTIPGRRARRARREHRRRRRVAWRQSASFSANGQRNRDNNFLLDGLDNNEVWLNSVAIFPNVDALDEMKVQTGIYAAEFGRSLGAVVSLQTKSGRQRVSRQCLRVRSATTRSTPTTGSTTAPDVHGPTSASISSAPRSAARSRNRTFFFGDYQGRRVKQDLTLVSTVPSDAMRQGDFSELNRVIYDPRRSCRFPGT